MLAAITKLFGTAPSATIEALVRQVADLSLESVVERVARRIDDMTLSEARGYVRARAAHIVRRQAYLAISQHREARGDWVGTIVPAATERLVSLVLRQTGVGVPRRNARPVAA